MTMLTFKQALSIFKALKAPRLLAVVYDGAWWVLDGYAAYRTEFPAANLEPDAMLALLKLHGHKSSSTALLEPGKLDAYFRDEYVLRDAIVTSWAHLSAPPCRMLVEKGDPQNIQWFNMAYLPERLLNLTWKIGQGYLAVAHSCGQSVALVLGVRMRFEEVDALQADAIAAHVERRAREGGGAA